MEKKVTMTNNDALELVAKSLEIIGRNKAMAICSVSGEFVYVTKLYNELMGNPQIIGKRFRDSNHPGIKYADQLKNIVLNVIETEHEASYFLIYQLPNTQVKRCYLNRCILLRNPETNDKIGILADVELFNCKYIGNVLNIANKLVSPFDESTYKDKIPSKVDYHLSDREKEVLFLLMIGRSYKEITYIINQVYDKSISISAINSIIRTNLFGKFKVFSVSSLIQVAANNLAIQEIPPSLLKFPEGFIEIDFS